MKTLVAPKLADHSYFHLITLIGTIISVFVTYVGNLAKSDPVAMGKLITQIFILKHDSTLLLFSFFLALVIWYIFSKMFDWSMEVADEAERVGWGWVFIMMNLAQAAYWPLFLIFLFQVLTGVFSM